VGDCDIEGEKKEKKKKRIKCAACCEEPWIGIGIGYYVEIVLCRIAGKWGMERKGGWWLQER
jgi:hypothetical protein